ncbi:MAG: YifB family Mg chelatase-like AAA ATPase [Alphaproteobacteria bacterium]|nr:YifB family Mg chelatase-like AAA ATPase [Alphaproteobacteria bacterium]
MSTRCFTVAFQGVDTVTIDVQVQIAPGLPTFNIVGLGDKAVNESKERIRAAFHSMNLSLPPQRVTVNLAPADFQKEGSHYDLPIALGILSSLGVVDTEALSDYFVVGEIGLDGKIHAVPGVLPSSIAAHTENKGLICPYPCAKEAHWSGLTNIVAGTTLLDVIHMLKHGKTTAISPSLLGENGRNSRTGRGSYAPTVGDFSDIKGQKIAKRALEIAAAGGHNALLSGPPGAGKSMLASRFVGLLPELTPEQALEVTMIHSLAGLLPESGLITQPPYRDPHHSATLPALVGGGAKCRPGEISLAHHGVLFLDELPEFNTTALESLRQPLETGYISIARANNMVRYMAKVQVIAAMNPCKCGYMGNPKKQCSRAPICGEQYQQKISGPLLDRFDVKVYVEDVLASDLLRPGEEESSSAIAARVHHARTVQYTRSQEKGFPKKILNAHLSAEQLQEVAPLTQTCEDLLIKASEKMHLSARGFHRILKVSRTIADLDGAKDITTSHLAEAIHFRQ